jgi:hypothetical protein
MRLIKHARHALIILKAEEDWIIANPPAFDADAIIQKRMLELHRDGYLAVLRGQWALTEKGWRTLCGAGEPRVPKPTSLRYVEDKGTQKEPKGRFPFGGQRL